ncbi:hypothetical protein AAFF_G00262220 [Aldrovandia affinis]|uniref:Uncharacterized protein n=1 Tax=Aldrovandia affinis TaxID=143900 RepID=A0AAD7SSF6_9TELE|nr:hypothetical protein AAFF_G00262220 [Aldrovandia affinis]
MLVAERGQREVQLVHTHPRLCTFTPQRNPLLRTTNARLVSLSNQHISLLVLSASVTAAGPRLGRLLMTPLQPSFPPELLPAPPRKSHLQQTGTPSRSPAPRGRARGARDRMRPAQTSLLLQVATT